MIPIRQIETIIRVRDELRELQSKADYLRRELDGAATEIIAFLEENGHLKRREK